EERDIMGQAQGVEPGSMGALDAVTPRRFKPSAPILAVVHMDQGELEHIGWSREAIAPGDELGTANGKQLLGRQAHDIKARPVAIAMADSEIYVLAGEIDMMEGSRSAQIDVWMAFGKATEAVDQPFGRKIRRRAHGEHAGILTLEQSFGADGNAVEGVADGCQIVAPSFSNDQALALAIEELDPELQFQGLDLVADGSLGHKELLGCAREALVSG